MRDFFKFILLASCFVFFTSCSSSRFNYTVEPTPLIKGGTHYSVKNIKVKIETFGIKLTKDAEVKGYLSEADMAKAFQEKITDYLKSSNLYEAGKKDGFNLSLTINYTRNFAVNSNKVVHPDFLYEWEIEKEGKTVATYRSPKMTMSGLSLFSEFLNTGSSDINPEAEQQYIDMISKSIVEDSVRDVGK
jgi:hypothetical protein